MLSSTLLRRWLSLVIVLGSNLTGCSSSTTTVGDSGTGGDSAVPIDARPRDPETAPVAMVDRFSETAGHLMVRSATNGLPAAGAAIDFDVAPFITRGLGPGGERVRYYNFDVQPTAPAPIFVLFREGESEPVSGQLNIVDVKPGDPGYNDFWLVRRVTVPRSYVANTISSAAEITAAGLSVASTTTIVNCPIVPRGSMARLRVGGGTAGTHRGWYRGQVVHYFTFEETTITGPSVPTSPIYVQFVINPDQPNGGPGSGFRTEERSDQTHNVLATLPGTGAYSPLWSVNVVDNAAFASVQNLATASAATILGTNVANVNCPVVEM